MALSISDLASKIQSQIETAAGGPPSDAGELSGYCTALATGIVQEIQSNAVANITGVQPGVGTATGTVE